MKSNQLARFFLLSGLSVFSNGAMAESHGSELDYFPEFPLVLSASRLSQPLEDAPNAMTVIDREMIIASGFRSIPDLFKLVPGMYVSYYRGSEGVVSYHGSTDQYARRMQVLLNGRSIYMSPASTVDWASLPITVEDIERIEVIRGPAAASHGANSTQGVISIITRDAGVENGGNVLLRHGNKGVNDVSASFGRQGMKLDYQLRLAYTADHGYDDLSAPPNNIPLTHIKAVGLLNNSNDSNQSRLLNYRADYHPDGSNSYDLQLGYNHNVRGVGFNDKNPNPAQPTSTNGNTFHNLISDTGFVQLGWRHLLQDASELKLRYAHFDQRQQENFPVFFGGILFAAPPTAQSLQVTRDELELQHTVNPSGGNRLVYGGYYGRDTTDGQGVIPLLASSYASSSRRAVDSGAAGHLSGLACRAHALAGNRLSGDV